MGNTLLVLLICFILGVTNVERDVDDTTSEINSVNTTERRLVDACYGMIYTIVIIVR